MSKITLTNLVNLQNETTAVNAINANNAAITTAMDNTLSRDGTLPNQLIATVDANSQRILNLPAPLTSAEPLRLTELNSFIGGGTVTNIPAGGTTNQVLAKTSNSDYAVGWTSESAEVIAGTNIAVTGGAPITVATVTTPTFTTVNTATIPTVVDTLVARNTTDTLTNKTLTSPAITTPTGIVKGDVGLGNVDNTSDVTKNAATATLTNKTFDTAGTGNSFSINGVAATANTGTGAVVRATSPALVTPTIGGQTISLGGAFSTSGGLAITPQASGVASWSGGTLSNTATTGSGNVVLATSPALVTPAIGAATGSSLILSGGSISFGTSGQGHGGTVTNDNAAAGILGEYVESVIASGSSIALTTGTAKTITSISLTAGDWDVAANVGFIPAATTSLTQLFASISLSTNTLDQTLGRDTTLFMNATVTSGNVIALPIQPVRFSLASTTTIFLVAQGAFTVSTLSGYGLLRARRVR
jgi:hypothetical protein